MRRRKRRPEPKQEGQEATQQSGAYDIDYFAQALHAVHYRSDGTLRDCFRDRPLPPSAST